MKKTLIILAVVVIAGSAYYFFMGPQSGSPLATPTPTPSVSAGGGVPFKSTALGITFSYIPTVDDQAFAVKESGDTVYVYPADLPYTSGQFVKVFQKRTDETLEASIRRQVLAGFSATDCTVEIDRSNIYPGASVAEIGYAPPASADEPYWTNAKLCNEKYARTNGIRYFLYDDAHPDRFVYLDIGQYAIFGDGKTPWQDTLRIVAK